MGLLTKLVRGLTGAQPKAQALDTHALMEMLRVGADTASGVAVSPHTAMKNTTVLRCVSLISFSVGMLPMHLQDRETKEVAAHPLDRILHRRPNGWQTAFEFRSLMQQRALVDGDAFALIVRSGGRVVSLIPLSRGRVQVKQRNDWTLEYRVTRPDGSTAILEQRDVFHIRYGISEDGYTGLSLVKQAAEAIGLALQTENAAARLFKNGMTVGGMLKHPTHLSPEAYERLAKSMKDREGADNAHKSLILEEGMTFDPGGQTGRDSQHIEQRKHQIEEIARPFGVPRPLLGVDDTSWGSGIDILGQMFVRYGLNPWFEAWQQAVERDLLTDAEAARYEAKFNPGALLRGSMKDQADFFAKGLGAGGHAPWIAPDEVRQIMDMPPRDDLPGRIGENRGGGDDAS
jgi:HK97 family phage portal protein